MLQNDFIDTCVIFLILYSFFIPVSTRMSTGCLFLDQGTSIGRPLDVQNEVNSVRPNWTSQTSTDVTPLPILNLLRQTSLDVLHLYNNKQVNIGRQQTPLPLQIYINGRLRRQKKFFTLSNFVNRENKTRLNNKNTFGV